MRPFILCWVQVLFMLSTCSVIAQKHQASVLIGLANYRSQSLSPSYQGKYTLQNGSSFDVGISYTRFNSNQDKSFSLYVGESQRTKHILSDSVLSALQQAFLSVQFIHHHTSINIVNEELSLRIGSGIYWNMLAGEVTQSLYKEEEKRGIGEINNVGLVIDVMTEIQIKNKQYLHLGSQLQVDVFASIPNSRLFIWKPYIGFSFRF